MANNYKILKLFSNAQSWHFLLLKTKAASTRPAALYKRTVAELDAIAPICNSHSCCKNKHIIVIFQTFSLFFAEFCKKGAPVIREAIANEIIPQDFYILTLSFQDRCPASGQPLFIFIGSFPHQDSRI
ncbi:MAG: hypothetical protein J5965_26415 [Aeriscardovia sp.]|nr:hypothetical protein [Aeriscardovia sp.]